MKNTMRILSLVLALVLTLGAVPFAAATNVAPGVFIVVEDGSTTMWKGDTIDLAVVPTDNAYSVSNFSWNNGNAIGTGEKLTNYAPTVSGTVTVKCDLLPVGNGKPIRNVTDSISITVNQPAGNGFAVKAGTGYVNQAITLEAVNAGNSAIVWSCTDANATVTGDTLTATKAGEYTVTATATNSPKEGDEKPVTGTITVLPNDYTVTFNDATFPLRTSNPKMVASVKKGAAALTVGTDYTVEYTSSNETVAKINSSTGALTLYKAGIAVDITAKVTIKNDDTVPPYVETAKLTVTASGDITMEQDGKSYDDDTIRLDFDIPAIGDVSNSSVDWDFDVSGIGTPSKTAKKFTFTKTGKGYYNNVKDDESISIDLKATSGYGIATIKAVAKYDNNTYEGEFYVSSYDDQDITVQLKDKVDEFDFDDDEVFKSVKVGTTTKTETNSLKDKLQDLLDDGVAEYISFNEGSKSDRNKNEDVGAITNTRSVKDYDNEKTNEYEIEDLDQLTFEVEDEGTFVVDYVQYSRVAGYSNTLITGEGTLKIVVGEGSGDTEGDVHYDVKSKGEVTFDEDDFEDFWDEYCDDEDIDEDLAYVVFTGYKATDLTGSLYAEDGDKSMKNDYRFHFDYDDRKDDGSKDYDLNEVVYKAHATKSDYTDEVDFTAYGEDGEKAKGTLTIKVGKGTVTTTMSFTDVKSTDWFYSSVEYVYTNGIMAGTSTTKFEPSSKLNRAMVVTMLYRIENQPAASGNSFSDVKNTSDWYYSAVCWAARNGIVNGITATTFAPMTNITREQLAAILYRYAGYKNQNTASTGSLAGFADASSVSAYAETAMKWAVGAGIINGSNGKLNPQGTATRAEAAAMFQRFMEK